jgi:hypothetical protein
VTAPRATLRALRGTVPLGEANESIGNASSRSATVLCREHGGDARVVRLDEAPGRAIG